MYIHISVCVCVFRWGLVEPSAWLNENILAKYLQALQWLRFAYFSKAQIENVSNVIWKCSVSNSSCVHAECNLLEIEFVAQFAAQLKRPHYDQVPGPCFMSCPQNAAVNMPGEQPTRRRRWRLHLQCPAMSCNVLWLQHNTQMLPVNGCGQIDCILRPLSPCGRQLARFAASSHRSSLTWQFLLLPHVFSSCHFSSKVASSEFT